MKKLFRLFLWCLPLAPMSLLGQIEASFGSFSQQEITMKECSFDKEAEAVILLDIAKAYPVDYTLVTERRVRIKILKGSAVERGNVIISFYSENDFESISEIEGLVHNTDNVGYPTVTKLEKAGIFRQKINERWSQLKLAMPEVKVGSIIEYTYRSTQKSWGGLDNWEFQSDIPTVLSKFDLTILPSAEFAYSVVRRSDLPISVKSVKEEGRIIFEMRNVAGLRAEPQSDAPFEYQQRVVFQLSKYNNGSGYVQKYSDSWAQLAKDLLNEPDFARAINKSVDGSSGFLDEVKQLPNEYDKMEKIYTFVRNNFSGNGFRSIFASEGLNRVWSTKKGNTGERNLLLINLLKEAKLDVTPLLVCDRSDGKVNKSYPFRDQFKKVVAFVSIEGKKYILDATDRYTPIGMVPFSLVNTLGFAVVWKNATEPFLIEAPKATIKTNTYLQCTLNANGLLTGMAMTGSYDYDRVERIAYWKESDEKKFLYRYFMDDVSDMEIDSFRVSGLEKETGPLIQQFSFKTMAVTSGDYKLVNLNMFTKMKVSPFLSAIRFTDINYGTPVTKSYSIAIKLEENVKPEELPKSLNLMMPDKSLNFQRQIVYEESRKEIQVRFSLEINEPTYAPEQYPGVSEFFKKMVDLLNEPLVVTEKK